MSDISGSAGGNDLVVPWLEVHRDPDPVSTSLSVALTQVVIEWGKFEYGLECDLAALRRYPNVMALSTKEPQSFKALIELWKRSINELYPTIDLYKNIARDICSHGKLMSHHRNRIIHGIWLRRPEGEKYEYEILATTGVDRIKKAENFYVDADYLEAVSKDIKTLSDKTYEFAFNRVLHAKQGLLKAASPAP